MDFFEEKFVEIVVLLYFFGEFLSLLVVQRLRKRSCEDFSVFFFFDDLNLPFLGFY